MPIKDKRRRARKQDIESLKFLLKNTEHERDQYRATVEALREVVWSLISDKVRFAIDDAIGDLERSPCPYHNWRHD